MDKPIPSHDRNDLSDQQQKDSPQPPQDQPSSTKKSQHEGMKPEDLPDSSNENRGATGSGQRQDSN